ncbi:MAG: hypothetical protein WED13_01965 [Methyloceanibacter sp.]
MQRGLDRLAWRRRHIGHGNVRGRAEWRVARRVAGAAMIAGLLVIGGQSGGGHSVGHYPSYYPDEIRIEAVNPVAAAKRLDDETLHAYVGAAPAFAGAVPEHIRTVRSLGSLLVLSFNTASPRFASAIARCTAARGILAALSGETAVFVFHPYPVTPYHADYLHHLDRVEAATAAIGSDSAALSPLKIGASGRHAEAIVKARWELAVDGADVVLEKVAADALISAAGASVDGWSGLPWMKEGWFQAHRLLAPALEARTRQDVDETYEHLVRGEAIGSAERVNLERHLLAALTDGCERVVAGYVPREEFIDDRYPAGIENVAYDSHRGLNSPVFIRTVKLKDYPWNGKLQLGVRDRSDAAWNPVAGFTDQMGRLVWAAVGDPAMIHFPFNASWMPNRVQSTVAKVEGRSGGIRVPADAIIPQPGTGAFQRAGARAFGSAKIEYEILASPFADGSKFQVADLIYPFAFTYRWGSKAGAAENAHEPRLAATFSAIQERLAGIRLVRVERTKHAIAEGMDISQETPVVEVYLRNTPGDERQVAALAPPWSTVPWHLLALMEEAVIRGYAAFSEEEARRRKVPWLDLVRDRALKVKLLELVTQFERERYRPEPLKEFVAADEAQARWESLRKFAETNGHFLVANGPYRLKQWTPDSVVLQAVREITYPLGFGTFDRFVNPPSAVIEKVTQDAREITVSASAEMALKAGRAYKITKEPLTRTTMRGTSGLLVVSRYLLIGPDGVVLNVDKMQWRDDGRFAIRLPERLSPGQYTVLLAVFLDGNSLLPSAKVLRFHVGNAGAPG